MTICLREFKKNNKFILLGNMSVMVRNISVERVVGLFLVPGANENGKRLGFDNGEYVLF